MFLCFLGRISLGAKAAVTRITESNHRRTASVAMEVRRCGSDALANISGSLDTTLAPTALCLNGVQNVHL